jgi:hypothetical protein
MNYLHLLRIVIIKKNQKNKKPQIVTNPEDNVEKKKLLYIVDGNINYYSHYKRKHEGSSKT